MSQLKNLDQIQFIGESNNIEIIEEKQIFKMSERDVDRRLTKIRTSKGKLELKLKWWQSLSNEQKQSEVNKKLILNIILLTVTPAILAVPALVYNKVTKGVSAIKDYELLLKNAISECDNSIELLEKRKKEFSVKHESYFEDNSEINSIYEEFIQESSEIITEGFTIKTMNEKQVDKYIKKTEDKLKLITERKKWWNGLSKEEKTKEKAKNFSKAFLFALAGALLIPVTIYGVSLGAFVGSSIETTRQKIDMKPGIFENYDNTLNVFEEAYKKQLQQLKDRKKELSAKHESSFLDNVKFI